MTNYEEGGRGLKKLEGGHVKFCPYKKEGGGGRKGFSHAEGGGGTKGFLRYFSHGSFS